MKRDVELVVIKSSFFKIVLRLRGGVLQGVNYESIGMGLPRVEDIYLGQVEERVDSLGGFFIKLDSRNKAFLKFSPKIRVNIGQKILVQVVKEGTLPDKLAVVSCDIGINGALIRFKGVSNQRIFAKKLQEEDKDRIIKAIGSDKYGFILRSIYKHDLLEELVKEYHSIKDTWESIERADKVGLLWQMDSTEKVVLSNSKLFPTEIISDDVEEIKVIKSLESKYRYLDLKVRAYISQENILDFYDISGDYESIFSKVVVCNDNMDLVFYEQEAFNYIDVNFKGLLNHEKEDALYKANMEIIPMVVNQIMLRNLGGQIFIDVLKVVNKQYRNNLLVYIKRLFDIDEVKTTVLGFSNLGLIEISRQKTRDSFNVFRDSSIEYQMFNLLQILKNSRGKDLLVELPTRHMDFLESVAKRDIDEIKSRVDFRIDFRVNENLKNFRVKRVNENG